MKQAASPIKTINAASLLNRLQAELQLTTDRALAQRLGLNAPVISKIRSGRSAITASFLIRAHEVTGRSIRELRGFMGDDAGFFASYRDPAQQAQQAQQAQRSQQTRSSLGRRAHGLRACAAATAAE